MKKIFNIILLAFPIKLLLWCLYSPMNLIDPFYDAFFTSSLFLFWVIAILHYDDVRVKTTYKRMNLISFMMIVIFIFTSPFLVKLGEKLAAYKNHQYSSSQNSEGLTALDIFSDYKKQNVE
jgi:hypothetical protein